MDSSPTVDSRDVRSSAESRLVDFVWKHGGADVRITGDFIQWSAVGLPMERLGSEQDIWKVSVRLRRGVEFRYKFIVDGEWQCDPDQPMATDETGHLNNVVLSDAPPATPPRLPANTFSPGLGPVLRKYHTEEVPRSGSESASSASVRSAVPFTSPIPAPASHTGGYIGVGVVREYSEEYGLEVGRQGAGMGGFGMVKSASVGDIRSLNSMMGIGMGRDTAAWRRMGKGLGMGAPTRGQHGVGGGRGVGGVGGDSTPRVSYSEESCTPRASSLPEESGGGTADGEGDGEDDASPKSTGRGRGKARAASCTPDQELEGSGAGEGEGSGEGDHSMGMVGDVHAATIPPVARVPAGPGQGTSTQRHGRVNSAGALPALAAMDDATVGTAVGIPVSIPIDRAAMALAHTGAAHSHTLSGGAVAGGHMLGHGVGGVGSAPLSFPQGLSLSLGLGLAHSGSGSGLGAGLMSPSSSTALAAGGGAGSGQTHTLSSVQAVLRREGKLVLAMVGLPARGKTFMARRLKRHLSWMGYRIEIYNVGNYRRKYLGANQPHDFFDPSNEEGTKKRNEMATIAFSEMVDALKDESTDIAIFDATNTTRERRRWLQEALRNADTAIRLVFIESVCNEDEVIRSNVRETKLKSPDYQEVAEEVAVADFLARIQHYTTVYQPLGSDGTEDDLAYIKLIDVGRQIIANRIHGFLNSRILFFLSNLHITPRPIWLTRHGESEYNVQGRIGGDSLLSPRGQAYALRLASFMNKMYPPGQPGSELVVWTSTLRRTMVTAAHLGREIVTWKALDEIDAGICDGMTYEAIAATMPEEYAARAKNKFTYRYPRGESYQDIVHRLEPVIIELMRQTTPVLIVSHQATLRVLYAYLTDKPPLTAPDVLLPLHTVVQLTQKAYGAEEVRHELM